MAAITAANRIIDATIWAASNKSNWPDETSSCKLLLLMVVYQVIAFTSVMAIELFFNVHGQLIERNVSFY